MADCAKLNHACSLTRPLRNMVQRVEVSLCRHFAGTLCGVACKEAMQGRLRTVLPKRTMKGIPELKAAFSVSPIFGLALNPNSAWHMHECVHKESRKVVVGSLKSCRMCRPQAAVCKQVMACRS